MTEAAKFWVAVAVLAALAILLGFLVFALFVRMGEESPGFESNWGGLGGGLGGWTANGALTLCFFVVLVLVAFVGVFWQVSSSKADQPTGGGAGAATGGRGASGEASRIQISPVSARPASGGAGAASGQPTSGQTR